LGDVGSFKSGVGFTEFEQGGKLGVPFFKVSDMNLESNQKVMTLAASREERQEAIFCCSFGSFGKLTSRDFIISPDKFP
jgi:hypothetical protein